MGITYIKATGEDIGRIVGRIENVIDGERVTNISIACIVVAIQVQKPNISQEELVAAVKNVSEFMAANLCNGTVN